jgi:cell division protein FtsW
LLVLFSATFYTGTSTRSPYSEVLKQLLGIGLGTAACIVTSRIPYRCWQHPYVVVGGLALSAVLLVLVIIPGVGVYINGSRRWLSLGGLSFQPSEIAKFAVVLYMATTLTYRGERIRHLFTGIVPVLVVPGVVFLLILEQPNLSTAGSILIVSLILIIMAGAKWRHILLMLVGGLGVGAFYAWSEPYRRRRLLSFRNPFSMMSDEGYQLSQSLIAFGSGGIIGILVRTGCFELEFKLAYLQCFSAMNSRDFPFKIFIISRTFAFEVVRSIVLILELLVVAYLLNELPITIFAFVVTIELP